ncbi:hypothetical protein BUALT_Bualt01G0078200 [Buddleja alternifolia]|uniref:J domain-containing protein n=1 Tax=Buddleja alternifolia TaxID=168488 RepID=A0AAV6Y7L2_9LAMI|nr:hypothetical protein BUALT_Bualt01G0078200 [Buddleja alternifolia]
MECNKDEALRSKSIAEGKLDKRDFAGARKLALKAQNLFPGLDGISQMLTTIDVYISAENKISGEVDWYGLLGLNPSVDDEAIKKQYRKLALMLHPDKNKSVGANGAFVLISEAFGMLSDKPKRLAYNQRRGFRVFQQKVPVPTSGSPSAPPPSTGNGSQSKTPKSQNKSTKPPPPPKPAPTPKPTPSFQRTDTGVSSSASKTTSKAPRSQNKTAEKPEAGQAAPNSVRNASFQQGPLPGKTDQSQTQGRTMPAAEKPEAGQAAPNSVRNASFQQGPLPGKTDPSVGGENSAYRSSGT